MNTKGSTVKLTFTLHIAFWVGKKMSGRKWEPCSSIFCRTPFCRFFLSALILAPACGHPLAFAANGRGQDQDVTPRVDSSPSASSLPLWSKQKPLWELARDQVDKLPLPPSDPQPVGTWGGGTALPLHNGQLKVSLWGPPERLTFSVGKTDVWDRRYFPEKPLTLEEIRERCFRDDYPQNPFSDRNPYYLSYKAYDFPTPKPVGQLILLAPELAGAGQPTAATRRGDGVALVPVKAGETGGQIEAVTLMTRNVLAVRGRFDGLKDAPRVRVYRHQDTIPFGTSWDQSQGKRRPCPDWDYQRDSPKNGPLAPPKPGSDGKHFWITQAMPPEATFPKGFWYVFMVTVVGGPGKIETVENQTGLGTEARMTPDRADGKYPGTDQPWKGPMMEYDPINAAPGAAATATLPGGTCLTLATVVTSAEAEDPMAKARQVLEEAERTGWEGLVAENRAWFEAFYRTRENGRVYFADANRNAGVVNEVAQSWTYAHATFTRPDPRRWELDRGYNYMNHDWAPWKGDIHFNEPNYTCWAVQNRTDRLHLWYGVGEVTLPAAKRTAQALYGCRGAIWPVGFVPIRTERNWHTSVHWEQGMDIQAQLAKMYWDHYDFEGDETFLRERAWPILLAGAEFYEDYLTLEDDGYFHVFPTVVQEYYSLTHRWEKNRDGISALSFIRWHLNTTARAAEILGYDKEYPVARWREMASKLAPYPTAEGPDGTVYVKIPGEPAGHYTGNLVPQAFPVMHTGEINLDTRDERRAIMERTLRTVKGWGLGNSPVLLGVQKDLSPEALLNSRSGRLHFFPAAAPGVDVGFRRFLARGAFEVSAERVGGAVSPIHVTSRRGHDLRIANPWPGRKVQVRDMTDGKDVAIAPDPEFPADPLIHTRPAHDYRITPLGPDANAGTGSATKPLDNSQETRRP